MRILQIITRSDLGGAQSVVLNLANALSTKHEVIVAAGNGDGQMWQMLFSDVIREYIPSLQRELSPLKEIQTIIAFRKLYQKYTPDIIHLHSSKVGILGRLSFPKSRIVYTVHGFDSIRIAYRKFLPLERGLQGKCSAIVGVSEYDRVNLLKEGVVHNVDVVYNGIEMPTRLKRNPFENLPTFKKKILCIARLAPPKNIDIFLEIASLLPEYVFIWIGNQQLFSGQYPKNVFFMGSLPNAGAYNDFVDLFMLSSNYEGLPMTIIEAMAFGKPVVASNVGGISEIVVNGENGYTVENSAEAFVEKILYILEHEDVYNKFSKAALKRFQEDLTVKKMTDGYLRIYDEIVKK